MSDNRSISFTCPDNYHNKIAVIKALRTLTGMGLKEAKDASELAGVAQKFTAVIDLSSPLAREQIRILQAENVVVNGVSKIIDDLRRLGIQALEQGEDELANEILQLVLAEKLRRKDV